MPVADVLTAVADHVKRAPGYDTYRDYEEGRHAYPYASNAFKRKFDWILKSARANACYTVRSNFTDLVRVESWSGAGAKAATELSEAIDLDMVMDLAVNEAWRCGDGYVLVWPDKNGEPRPWYHRADQVGFRLSPDDPSTIDLAWKIWVDAAGYGRVNLYSATEVERWVTLGKVRNSDNDPVSWDGVKVDTAWGPYIGDGEPEIQAHDFGEVPWVHVPFDAQSQGGHGRSILRDVIPLQDGLNHAVHAIIVNTEQYARPVRALMNYEADRSIDPTTGKQRESKLEVDETRDSVFGFKGDGPLIQLDPPNSENILAVKRDWHTDIANTVGVPVSDVVPDLGNIPSGAALRVLAARRTATVRSFLRASRGKFSTVMRLLGVPDAFPEFADPAPTDATEQLELAEARSRLGVPLEENLRQMGYDDADLKRVVTAAAEENRRAVQAFRERQEDPEVMGSGVS